MGIGFGGFDQGLAGFVDRHHMGSLEPGRAMVDPRMGVSERFAAGFSILLQPLARLFRVQADLFRVEADACMVA